MTDPTWTAKILPDSELGDSLVGRWLAGDHCCPAPTVDRSDAADARRFRWLLNGNGYFLEEERRCGHGPCPDYEQDEARQAIDLCAEYRAEQARIAGEESD